MKWLVLLVLAGVATAADLKLGDSIVAIEKECERIYKLNENWGISNFHEQAAQYIDLYFICVDSLNENKYAYIDKNNVDMSQYPGENDKFPVETSEGEILVTKPPPRKPQDKESMKKTISDYLTKTGGMSNPIYRLMDIQSEMGQEVVDKQVECEILALYFLKHPEDKDSEPKHIECINQLNCIKERFMEQHSFTRKHYPDFFPILYKRRGTMIKTPPKVEKSLCETPDSTEGSKSELEKWMTGIEYIGEEMRNIGGAGTDLIQKLIQKGVGAGEKFMTRKDLNDLMNVVTPSGDDEETQVDDEKTNIQAKGVKIAHAQLQKAKPAIQTVQNIASLTGEKLKKLEEEKVKPAIKNTNFKEKSKNAVKGGLATAGSVAQIATSKAKEEGSILMSKLKSHSDEESSSDEGSSSEEESKSEEATNAEEEHEEDDENPTKSSQSDLSTVVDNMIQPEYLPSQYGETKAPGLIQILKDMGGHSEDGESEISNEDLKDTITALKERTRKDIENLNLSPDKVNQSANLVKGVMHALLSAASHGYGAAKDMTPEEIDKAKARLDHIVNYAVAEILNKDNDNKEEKIEDGEDEAPMKEGEEDNNKTTTTNGEADQTAAENREEKDKTTSGEKNENGSINKEAMIPGNLNVPNIK